MAWIKIDTTLKDKPEVMAIQSLTGLNATDVIGKLVLFWCWADGQTENGFVDFLTPEMIDKIVFHDGFFDAMEKVSWIKKESSGVKIANFDIHNGSCTKKRIVASNRKAMIRSGLVNRVPKVSEKNETKARHERDKNETRGEERRGEKSKRKEASASKEKISDDILSDDSIHDSGGAPTGSKVKHPEKLDYLISEFEKLPRGSKDTGALAIGHRVNFKRGKSLVAGWNRVMSDSESRTAFDDVPLLIEKIRNAKFCHGKKWFNLQWILKAGKDQRWNAVKLLENLYINADFADTKSNQKNDVARVDSGRELPDNLAHLR